MMTLARMPLQITAFVPTAAIIAPSTPPISACDDDDGMLKYQVTRFQMIAPTRPAKTIGTVTRFCSTMPEAIVAATETEMNAPAKLRIEASATATRGLQRARGDRGRHGVRRVVEAVREIEEQRSRRRR